MSKWKSARYADAATSRVGLMICSACGKHIENGQFRYRETAEAYIPQHRACSEEDPNWARLDREDEKHRQKFQALEKDARDFIAKWGVVDLSDFEDA